MAAPASRFPGERRNWRSIWRPRGEARECAVIGCGVVGLATARLLAGTRLLPVDLRAGDAAADHIQPGGRALGAGLRLRPRARHAGIPQRSSPRRRASAFRRYQSFAGEPYGVRWLPLYTLSRDRAYITPPPTSPNSEVEPLYPEAGAVDRRPASLRCTVCPPPAHAC